MNIQIQLKTVSLVKLVKERVTNWHGFYLSLKIKKTIHGFSFTFILVFLLIALRYCTQPFYVSKVRCNYNQSGAVM